MVAEDTDTLILSVYIWNSEIADLLNRSKEIKIHEISEHSICMSTLSSNVVHNILFIHAWSGCDTTSSTYGHGKTTFLKMVEKGHSIVKICSTFNNSSHMEIDEAGHKLFCIMYGKVIICHHYLQCRNSPWISWWENFP